MDGENRRIFGLMPDGRPVEELTLRDGKLSASVLTFGASLRALTVPDREGRGVDVALGLDSMEDYLRQTASMGAVVGRYANRIAGARFTLNGRDYPLEANDGPNHLHGGSNGFGRRVWTVEELSESSAALALFSPDGDGGYPGGLRVRVTYTLRDGALELRYRARSEADTLCNLTNHTYFNLSGHGSGPVGGQYIRLMAGRYTPVLPGSIPTGEIAPVDGTPMDLRTARPMGERADEPFPQLALAGGYDHNWAVDGWEGSLRPAAGAWSPRTGIAMDVFTTLPGVQFYTGNFLDGCPAGKGGAPYAKRWGFCLETQFYPDSPHHPNFPTAVLRAGEEFVSSTIYRFGVSDRP